jgi:hypothetical protein
LGREALLEGGDVIEGRLAAGVERAEVLRGADAALLEDVEIAVVEQAVV